MTCSPVLYGLAFLSIIILIAIFCLWWQKRRFSQTIDALKSRSQLEHITQEQQYMTTLHNELQQVAGYIHEHLGGAIAVLHRQIESRLLETTDYDQRDWLAGLSHDVKDVYDVARGKSHELFYREADKAEQVFADHIEEIAYAILPKPQYHVDYGVDPGALRLLPREHFLNLLLVIREVLVNINKHAKAKHVSILFYEEQEGLVLSVKDDGIGFDTSVPAIRRKAGIGLPGLKRRISGMNGLLEITSGKKGTEVLVTFAF